MDAEDLVGLIHDIAIRTQGIHMHTLHGRNAEAHAAFDEMAPFLWKCIEERVTFCIMMRRMFPAPNNQHFAVTTPIHLNWPPPRNPDSSSEEKPPSHVHLVLTYRITHQGHTEIQPDGIDAEIVQIPEKESHTHHRQERNAPPKGERILSEKEMKEFFQKYGLGDLGNA